MENNTIRNIFKKDIEFKFKLEDLFTLQFGYDDYNSDGYAYIEELKNKVKEETLATIVNHIFNQLKPAIQDIKDIIYEEVREYRKNAEIIIKKEAKTVVTVNLEDLKEQVLKEMKENLITDILKNWEIQYKEKELKNEVLKLLEGGTNNG